MSQSSSDSQLVSAIVQTIKSRGIFDDFRRQCLSDADTKPSFQNLLQRVEGYVSKFLSQQKWNQNINKNHLRERLRKQINESGMLKYGIEHLVEQVVNYKINSLFWPKIEDVVKEFLGIVEIPVIIDNFRSQTSDDKPAVKAQASNEEFVETQVKTEPLDECQPMDIETDSNASTDLKISSENPDQNLNITDSNDCNDWPTPPKPEMITPDRVQTNESPKEESESNDNSNNVLVKTETVFGETNIKENETFMINKTIMDELKNSKSCESSDKKPTKAELKEKIGVKVKTEELSDVSSVHTSDLSDFDDEISLDDSNDEKEDYKKKKISLKVAKKISSEMLSKEPNSGHKELQKQSTSRSHSDGSKSTSETKRIRKVNPKYSSKEFSSIFSEKRRTESTDCETKESTDEPIKCENEPKMTRKRRQSNCSDDIKEIAETDSRGSKSSKKAEEIQIDSRCSSRGSIESSLSETTQDSAQSQRKSNRRKSKNRNESQTQRYESSDLYKPRPMISSRRQRAPTTPDSSNQSNEDFVVHDLSK